MNDVTKKWIEAGKLLAKDKSLIVQCPECEIGHLLVKDEEIKDHSDKIDRYLICSNCGKWNVITIQK